jgi:uncharacterized LabA/DUF88 family protein
MTRHDDAPKVAIYWDFENLHAILANLAYGENAYRDNRFSTQPVLIDIKPILDYAASFGDVIINRAYGNWQWFSKYREDLNKAGIDLIQIFPRGQGMKNSADIRLTVDALSDVYTHSHLSHVVVVSSDSDFIALSQRIKQTGRFVAGIGVEGLSNRFWISSCNDFKFYQHLVNPRAAEPLPETPVPAQEQAPLVLVLPAPQVDHAGSLSFDEARDALQRALRQLVERRGENYIPKATLKHSLKRLLPVFDETLLGFQNFTEFLTRCGDIVRTVDSDSGGHVALVEGEFSSGLDSGKQASVAEESMTHSETTA